MPRTTCYLGDSGKHTGAASGGASGVPHEDGGKDEGAREVFSVESLECNSRETQEEYFTKFEYENLDQDPHSLSFSHVHNGDNTPYADQHAPQVGPKTPGPKKGSA